MYRVGKVLNHNSIIVVSVDDTREYLVMGKGIGFGKKVTERIELPESVSVYALEEKTRRGSARELARNIPPEFLEIANAVLQNAEKKFGHVDRSILFPMADHIEYAVKRMQNHEYISNPLTEDIRILFADEYAVALTIVPLLKKNMGVDINEDEVGYVALHVHTAIEKEDVSQAMQTAQAVKECVAYVEQCLERKLDTHSVSFHRLMNHVRFMVIRAVKGEEIQLNINDYMEHRFPVEFAVSKTVCEKLGESLKYIFTDSEIGYLAMHLQRVVADEQS